MGAGPRLRRRSTARLEQSARRDPSQLIAGYLQTFTENSLLYPVFYSHSFYYFYTARPDIVNLRSVLEVSFFYLRHSKVD